MGLWVSLALFGALVFLALGWSLYCFVKEKRDEKKRKRERNKRNESLSILVSKCLESGQYRELLASLDKTNVFQFLDQNNFLRAVEEVANGSLEDLFDILNRFGLVDYITDVSNRSSIFLSELSNEQSAKISKGKFVDLIAKCILSKMQPINNADLPKGELVTGFILLRYINEACQSSRTPFSIQVEYDLHDFLSKNDINHDLECNIEYLGIVKSYLHLKGSEPFGHIHIFTNYQYHQLRSKCTVIETVFKKKIDALRLELLQLKSENKATADKEIQDLRKRILKLQLTYKENLEKLKKDITDKYERALAEREHLYHEKICKLENDYNKSKAEFAETISSFNSNLKTFPYLAGVLADIKTSWISDNIRLLDYGNSKARKEKIASLIEIRKQAKEQIERANEAYYDLQYLLELFPSLQDVIDSDYNAIKYDLKSFKYVEFDPVKNYLSEEEYSKLSVSKKNQLALDRYVESRSKNSWQIGRDYELYIGQTYSKKGWTVDFYGSYKGVEDLGRDLICEKDGCFLIIQCKFWSREKIIHENHICQLYGSKMEYCFEKGVSCDKVKAVFVTNIYVSDTARKFARFLDIELRENVDIRDFPRIKCNIGRDESGKPIKIYHLPMDLSYDSAKIVKTGEFFAKTVSEAESKGFRRSYKWFGGK